MAKPSQKSIGQGYDFLVPPEEDFDRVVRPLGDFAGVFVPDPLRTATV